MHRQSQHAAVQQWQHSNRHTAGCARNNIDTHPYSWCAQPDRQPCTPATAFMRLQEDMQDIESKKNQATLQEGTDTIWETKDAALLQPSGWTRLINRCTNCLSWTWRAAPHLHKVRGCQVKRACQHDTAAGHQLAPAKGPRSPDCTCCHRKAKPITQ